ncbi:hypothetical protein C8F01DRAFT_140966 [Mycena amicta]|nr:hypothetical protein C8F01DRAFT_140966 [Mycena amicta]
MCRWRQVRNTYLRCGHSESLPPVEIHCESSYCKFSPYHPKHCVPPACRQSCNQYHLFPEQYSKPAALPWQSSVLQTPLTRSASSHY